MKATKRQRMAKMPRKSVSFCRSRVIRTTSTNRRMIVNRVSIDPKPFKCDVIGCTYAGARKAYLKNHMKSHKTVFECNSCDKKYLTKHLLTEHNLEHDDTNKSFEHIDKNEQIKVTAKQFRTNLMLHFQ